MISNDLMNIKAFEATDAGTQLYILNYCTTRNYHASSETRGSGPQARKGMRLKLAVSGELQKVWVLPASSINTFSPVYVHPLFVPSSRVFIG